MRPVKKAALLHDLCGVGKAALTNMIPVLSVMGVEACPIPTILLSTHTGGYGKPAMEKISTTYIRKCADHYVANHVTFDLIFVGYLGSEGMIEAVEYFLSCFPNTEVIMDPIMGDHGVYYSNFDCAYGQSMRRLLSYADIVLPNLTEACLLADMNYSAEMTKENVCIVCEKLKKFGAKTIVMTSVPCALGEKGIALYENDQFTLIDKSSLACEYHGTGDTFDGVFVGAYLNGRTILEALELAHRFVYACVEESACYDYEEREGLMIEKNLSMLV